MTTVEIPLTSDPETFNIDLGGAFYRLTLRWTDPIEGGWLLDIADAAGNDILCGAPLVTGHDILEQYKYLGIDGSLVVTTDGDSDAMPTSTNLGAQSHLYFTTP